MVRPDLPQGFRWGGRWGHECLEGGRGTASAGCPGREADVLSTYHRRILAAKEFASSEAGSFER
jgi:hypothetical protein